MAGPVKRGTLLCVLTMLFPLLPIAFARPPPGSDPNSARAQWFERQVNMMGGMCCKLGDGHELNMGDTRYNEVTGLWSVRLPDPSISTFGTTLDQPTDKPKRWVEIALEKMRDPKGGAPPISSPIIWYDTYGNNENAGYSIYCFEPNFQD